MADKKRKYTWLPGSRYDGIIEPTERVPGEWKDAWAERLARWAKTAAPVHPSSPKDTEGDAA